MTAHCGPTGGRFIRIPNWTSSSSRSPFPTRRSRLPMSSTCRPGPPSRCIERSTFPPCKPVRLLRATANRKTVRCMCTGSKTTYNDLFLQGQVSWEPDLWGNIRRQVEAQRATAQATAADLANVDLSLRSELALDYFELRGLDTQQRLLDNTVQQYEQYLDLTKTRFAGGVATESDVALAQTQLDQTRAQAIDVGVARAQYEHAIATLTGVPASSFSLPPAPLDLALPQVPVGVPSQLLERRPDVAAAERRANAANAQIGVAIAAYYPTINIGGTGGFESKNAGTLIQGPSSLWSLGGSAVELLFDAGRRHALTEEARDVYEQNVANYRQTVLQAFQEVEDNLSGLRILNSESVGTATGSRLCAAFARHLHQPLQGRGDHLP